MTEESMPASLPAGADSASRTGSGFTPNTPLILAVAALAGAFGSLHEASAAETSQSEPTALTRMVEDAQPLVDPAVVASEVAPLPTADLAESPGSDAQSEPSAAVPVSTPEQMQVSAADRLRVDPLETATSAPPEPASPSPPVKLTKEEQAVAVHITRNFGVERGSIERIVHHAFKAAREVRLDPNLILAVMAVESRFDPNASNNSGAKGLMQVHVKVHRNRFEPFGGANAVYDPPANIKVGAGILSEYVAKYGDVAAGLKAYVGAALLPSDRGYGSKVLNRQAEFDAVLRSNAAATREARAQPSAEGNARHASALPAASKADASDRDGSSGNSDIDESM